MAKTARVFSDVARVYGRTLVRAIAVVAMTLVAGAVVLWLYAISIGPEVYRAAEPSPSDGRSLVLASALALLPLLVVFTFLSLVWAGAVALLAERGFRKAPASTTRAIGLASRRSLKTLGTLLLWLVAVLLAIAAAPVLVVLGVAGLVVAAVARGDRRPAWLPALPVLIAIAIPFGAAIAIAVRWALALPAAWLDGLRPRAAVERAWRDSSGRAVAVGATLFLSLATVVLLTEGAAAIVRALTDVAAAPDVARVGVQLIVGAIPIIALVVLYLSEPHPGRAGNAIAPRRGARTAKVAVAMALVFAVNAVVAGGPVAPASADPLEPTFLEIYTAPASNIQAGNEFTLGVTVKNGNDPDAVLQPTGNISVSIDSAPLAGPFILDGEGGSVSIPYPAGLPAGTYDVEVSYAGDATFIAANTSASFTVNAPTSVSVTVDDGTLDFGETFGASATVSGVGEGGSVTFIAYPSVGPSIDLGAATTDSGGMASVSSTTLPPAEYTVVATYAGNAGGNVASSSGVPFTVSPLYTTITVVLTPTSSFGSPSPAGGTVTATATVASIGSSLIPQGHVEIYPDGGGDLLDSEELVDGSAVLTMVLPSGAPVVRATFYAEPGFYGSFTTEQQYVAGVASSTSLDVDATSEYGDTVTLAATVTATETVTGTVDFYMTPEGGLPTWIGNRAVNLSGVATLDVTGLDAGNYTFRAAFAGSSTVGESTSANESHTVEPAPVTVTVDITSTTSPYFDGEVLATVTVTPVNPAAGIPSGTLTLLRDADELSTGTVVQPDIPLTAGVNHVSFNAGDAGAHSLIARFVPDENFAGGEGSASITSQQRPVTVHIEDENLAISYGELATFTGAVTTTGTLVKPGGTVVLYADEFVVGTGTLDGDGNFSISSDSIPALATPGTRILTAKYQGSANFPATDSDTSVDVEVDLADEAPTVTLGTGEVGIGGTYALKATLPSLGAGATGTVTFTVTVDGDETEIGPVPVTAGVASTSYLIFDSDTYVVAAYSGDANFEPRESAEEHFVADRAAATVELTVQPDDDPDVYAYGNVFEIVAKVTIAGGLETDGLVDFRTVGGMLIAEDVETEFFPSQGIGVARVEVCAGDSAGCPLGTPNIGTFDQEFIAVYPEGSLNIAGTSNTVPYAMTKAPVDVVLTINPSHVAIGDGVLVTAYLTNLLSGGATPTGEVSFYSLNGTAENYLGSLPLNSGIATGVFEVGTGTGDILLPSTGIIARYYDVNQIFGSDFDSKALTFTKIPTTVTVVPGTATWGSPASIQVNLTHTPASMGTHTGEVKVYLDGSLTPVCTLVPGVNSFVTCPVTWASVGNHTVTAEYAGDALHASGSSATTPAVVSKATPNLGAGTDVALPIALTDTTVTWNPGLLTGTMTVTADGTEWCSVSVAAGSCVGQFTNASVTGAPVDINLQYSGDANYNQVFQTLPRSVTGCRILDVYSVRPSQGTVSVTPAPSCGTGGYPAGTSVTATATPIAPNVFAQWLGFTPSSSGLVPVPGAASTTFTITNDTWTWVRAADFRLPCVTVTQQVSGQGYLLASRPTDCTTLDGKAGYIQGGTVTFQPIGNVNPLYDVRDVYYAFGALPAGVVAGTDLTGYPKLTVTLTNNINIPVTFGPRCVQVNTALNPADAVATVALVTPTNCSSPVAAGYLPRTKVTAEASALGPDIFIAGWSTSQVGTPTLPAGNSATLTVGLRDVTLTANALACYTVTVVVDAPRNIKNRPVGSVALTPAANCPDGSDRYLAGTEVTATPETLGAGTFFVGWDGATNATVGTIPPAGPLPQNAKTFTVNSSITVTASFFLNDVCSRLQEFDRGNVVTFGPTGCGPGFYYDLMTQLKDFVGPEHADEIWADSDRSVITATKTEDTNLDVYASVSGDTRECFGVPAGTPDGPTQNVGWRSLGVMGSGPQDCLVGGSVAFRFEQCQTLDPDVAIYREGDDSSTRFGKDSLPGVLYVPTAAGNFAPMSPQAFAWVAAQPLEVVGEELEIANQAGGACKDSGHAYQPDMTLMIGADSPAAGITFLGWTSDEANPLLEDNPVLIQTDDTRPVIPVSAAYALKCYHVTFGEGITIEGDAPRCPGYADEDNMFIGGTGILIRAVQNIDGRTFGDWVSGVVRETSVEDEVTGQRTAFAFVTGDMTVSAKYPTEGERLNSAFANAGKIMLGITAVAGPILLGIACPPCGIALATVAIGSLIASSIPGGGTAAAFFDLINPAKILECTSTWGFGNTKVEPETIGDPTATDVLNLANKERKVITFLKPPPTAAELAKQAAKAAADTSKTTSRLATLKVVGKAGLQLAAFGYGLYDAGLFATDLGYQTEGDLRDTANFTKCVSEAARLVT